MWHFTQYSQQGWDKKKKISLILNLKEMKTALSWVAVTPVQGCLCPSYILGRPVKWHSMHSSQILPFFVHTHAQTQTQRQRDRQTLDLCAYTVTETDTNTHAHRQAHGQTHTDTDRHRQTDTRTNTQTQTNIHRHTALTAWSVVSHFLITLTPQASWRDGQYAFHLTPSDFPLFLSSAEF